MTKREQQATIIAAISLLAFGTAFAFFGSKKKKEEECKEGETLDADGNCVRTVIVTPPDLSCPPGQHRERDACVADEVKPNPSDIDDLIKTVPIGGHFYRVKYGDWPGYGSAKIATNPAQGLGIATMLVRREAFEAAKEFGGLSDEAAWIWVNNIMGGSKVISPGNKTLNVILCSAFNDACYGTWGYCGDIAIQKGKCPAVQRNHPGPHGRAIRLLKQHPDNIARVKQGQGVARYVTVGTAANAGDGSSANKTGRKPQVYPQLWMPKLDRARLWATGANGFPQNIEIEASPETWDDSSPQSSPPPFIMRGGEILDYSGTLHLPGSFGCADQAVTFRLGG
jgi:hypothetical protein